MGDPNHSAPDKYLKKVNGREIHPAAAELGVALRCGWVWAIGARDVRVLGTFVFTAGLAVLIIFGKRNSRLSYEYPEKTGTLDVVVGLGSLIGTLVLKIWIDKQLT